jgi:hypothetical protein
MKRVAHEEKPDSNPLKERKNLEPRVLGRQAADIGIIPDDFCAEDPEILEMFGLK